MTNRTECTYTPFDQLHNTTTKWSAQYIGFIVTHIDTEHSKKSSLCQIEISTYISTRTKLFEQNLNTEQKLNNYLHESTAANNNNWKLNSTNGWREKLLSFLHFFSFNLNCKCVKTDSSHHVHLPFAERKENLRRITIGGCGGEGEKSFHFNVPIRNFPFSIDFHNGRFSCVKRCGEKSRVQMFIAHHSEIKFRRNSKIPLDFRQYGIQ